MTKKMKTTIGVSAILLTLAIAAMAFAHGGYGYGRHNGGYGGQGNGRHMGGYGGYGNGRHMGGYGGYGYGRSGELPEETREKIHASREAFYKQTRQLRNQLEEARIALRDEIRKKSPDKSKMVKLQTSLSSLRAEFDQKALSHDIAMRKLLPEDYHRGGYGRGQGYGNCGD